MQKLIMRACLSADFAGAATLSNQEISFHPWPLQQRWSVVAPSLSSGNTGGIHCRCYKELAEKLKVRDLLISAAAMAATTIRFTRLIALEGFREPTLRLSF